MLRKIIKSLVDIFCICLWVCLGKFIKGHFKLKSGWRRISLSCLLTVKGTVMRYQGSFKGEGTHTGNLCVDAQIVPNPDSPVGGAVDTQRKTTRTLNDACRHPADIFLFTMGVMREQGSLKGEGTHRGNLCVDAQIVPNPDSPVGGAVHIQRKNKKNVT